MFMEPTYYGGTPINDFYGEIPMSDLNKSFPVLMQEMVKAANPVTAVDLLASHYTIGAATPSTEKEDRNTKSTLTAVANSGFANSQDVWYNRLDVEAIAATGNRNFDAEGKVKLSDLVAEFNTRFATKLTAGVDYTDGDLPEFTGAPGEEKTVTLTALPASFIYLGEVELVLKAKTRDLAEVIANNVLDGLTYVPPQ